MRMLRKEFWMGLALLAVVGCAEGTPPADTTAATTPAAQGGASQAAIVATSDEDQEKAEIQKLPAAERGAALAQKTCPVSEGNLGSMGTPIKKVVNGQTVFLCCDGCVKDLEEDPEKYLAKLKP
jgi:YHS domain-containing protein